MRLPTFVVAIVLYRVSTLRYNLLMPAAATSIRVKVLFFGRVKEIVGCAESVAGLADGASIEQLFSHLCSRTPQLIPFRSSLVASCNQEFADWNTPLHSGDEVAFLPPVSGG